MVFLQMHVIIPYYNSLLNRDETGISKECLVGGSNRTRVSSQCIKRWWRDYVGKYSMKHIGGSHSTQSREIFGEIAESLVNNDNSELLIRLIISEISNLVTKGDKKATEDLDKSEKTKGGLSKSKKNKENKYVIPSLETPQLITLGSREVLFLEELAKDIYSDDSLSSFRNAEEFNNNQRRKIHDVVESYFKAQKEDFKSLKNGAGIEAGMFGRMSTSDYLTNVEAPIHVSHSFTVHEMCSTPDYFSAVDELRREGG
ncbi:MAG: type I-E CRISPR-associated protein Cas7/Cse4/CasC, partial [Candidatus Hodarchaeales archaeon]